jgi:predicted lipase
LGLYIIIEGDNVDNFLVFCCQACINSYYGSYGEVKDIFDKQEKFKIGHVEGFFGYIESDLYVVFQGSMNLKDWIDNLKIFHETVYYDKASYVHRGFMDQYEIIKDLIRNKVKDYNRIFITGHSLGGALATLCADDIFRSFSGKDIKVVTFGCPKVGNSNFVDVFNSHIIQNIRVVNSDDIVPSIPSSWLGYRHVNGLVEIGPKHWYHYFGSVRDHLPQHYLESLISV